MNKSLLIYLTFLGCLGFGLANIAMDLNTINLNQSIQIIGTKGAFLGGTISTGDINGDGIDDYIIGAELDNLLGRELAGAVYVIYGNTSGLSNIELANNLSLSQGFTIIGARPSDNIGQIVGNVDLNGDGINDLILGAPGARAENNTLRGVVYVVYGSKDRLSNVDLANFTSNEGFLIMGSSYECGYLGHSLANAGDINADGIDDLLIGGYLASPLNRSAAGATYVIYGNKNGFSTINLASNFTLDQGFQIIGAEEQSYFGDSLSRAGDVNGDGIDDIIIGAFTASPLGRNMAGAAYVIYGNKSQLPNIDLAKKLSLTQGFAIIGAKQYDGLGSTVSGGGDVNGDGFPDLVISAGGASPLKRNSAGIVYVIYGKGKGFSDIDLSKKLTHSQGFTVLGADEGDLLGDMLSDALDINKDGIDDIIITADMASPDGKIIAGAVYVIYGNRSGLPNIDLANNLTSTQGFTILGSNEGGTFGAGLSSIGDVNGDGVVKLIIGAPRTNPRDRSWAGTVYIFVNPTDDLGSNSTANSLQPNSRPITSTTIQSPTSIPLNGESKSHISF